MNQYKVYIITINFGTPEHTIECLESICVNSHELFQVLVVDVLNINQSVEKITRWIDEKNDSRFSFIQEKENKGFAYANNIGIRYSLEQPDCDFIWVLNNDTVIAQNALEELLNCYEQDKNKDKAGFYGSKILDYKDKELIQNVGGTFNKWTGYSVLLGMGEKDAGQHDKEDFQIDYVIGASMFCHSSLVQKIGFMPEDYFLYYEDIDWCLSAKKAGFKNQTSTKSKVYHKQGISTGAKLLGNDVGLEYKKYLYSSYKKLYTRHFRMLMPVAYFILFKQLAGRIFHGSSAEAKLILKVLFTSR